MATDDGAAAAAAEQAADEDPRALGAVGPGSEALLRLTEERRVELAHLGDQVEEDLQLRLGRRRLRDELLKRVVDQARMGGDEALLFDAEHQVSFCP